MHCFARSHALRLSLVGLCRAAAVAGLLLLADGALPCAIAAGAIPPGRGETTVVVNDCEITVYTYRPENYQDGPLLVVLHGMNRNGDTYRDNSRVLADRLGALLVAPNFDIERFPSEAYQSGGITKNREVQDCEKWTVSMIPKIADEVRTREGRSDMPYYLIGHSAGGQFLVRLAAMIESDARRIVAVNPGSLIFPTCDVPYPHGFGKLPDELCDDAALRRFLAQPLTLYLGTADVGSKNLPSAADAFKQGATRIERGTNCFEAARKLAEKNGWPFGWRLVTVEGIGHSGKAMFEAPEALEAIGAGKHSIGVEPDGQRRQLRLGCLVRIRDRSQPEQTHTQHQGVLCNLRRTVSILKNGSRVIWLENFQHTPAGRPALSAAAAGHFF